MEDYDEISDVSNALVKRQSALLFSQSETDTEKKVIEQEAFESFEARKKENAEPYQVREQIETETKQNAGNVSF